MLHPTNMTALPVGVLGLGRSGMAAAHSLCAAGATVFMADDHGTTATIPAGCKLVPWQDWPWESLALLVISPGIPHLHPTPHPAAEMAREHGVEIVSEIEIALRAQPQARLVTVTGTNGKSTATALIGHCLASADWPVTVGGNIGDAACGLTDPGPDGVIVLELSSYQLETTPSLCSDIAILLNITPDHLDRHNGMDGYVAAKTKIFDQMRDGGLAVIGTNDPYVGNIGEQLVQRGLTTQQIDHELAPAWLAECPSLRGTHNAENAVAALLALRQLGMDDATIAAGMRSFAGLPHRMQHVAQWRNIAFIDDSKATNGVAAAKSMGAFDNIYWIAGGTAKEDGIGAAADALDQIHRAYLIGASADAFADQLSGHVPTQIMGDLDSATRAAFADACDETKRDALPATILLAPAAASFDQFDSFVARGEAFAALAQELTHPTAGGAHA